MIHNRGYDDESVLSDDYITYVPSDNIPIRYENNRNNRPDGRNEDNLRGRNGPYGNERTMQQGGRRDFNEFRQDDFTTSSKEIYGPRDGFITQADEQFEPNYQTRQYEYDDENRDGVENTNTFGDIIYDRDTVDDSEFNRSTVASIAYDGGPVGGTFTDRDTVEDSIYDRGTFGGTVYDRDTITGTVYDRDTVAGAVYDRVTAADSFYDLTTGTGTIFGRYTASGTLYGGDTLASTGYNDTRATTYEGYGENIFDETLYDTTDSISGPEYDQEYNRAVTEYNKDVNESKRRLDRRRNMIMSPNSRNRTTLKDIHPPARYAPESDGVDPYFGYNSTKIPRPKMKSRWGRMKGRILRS